MSQLSFLWKQFVNLWHILLYSLSWKNALDIAIVAVLVYQVVKLIRQTRANSVLKGLFIFLVVTWLSEVLGLNALNWVLLQVVNLGLIILVVLFQPEIRRGLEHMGRYSLKGGLFIPSERGHADGAKIVSEMTDALVSLSRRKVGALIVLEQHTGLEDILPSGTRLDAEITAALLENIFEPNTPLHDGAVVVRNGRIHSAGCVLPLTENTALSRELGTRHRAAIGISETTDAVVLIASEETGILSVARDGKLTRHLDARSLTALLSDLYTPSAPEKKPLLERLFRKEARQ